MLLKCLPKCICCYADFAFQTKHYAVRRYRSKFVFEDRLKFISNLWLAFETRLNYRSPLDLPVYRDYAVN